MRRWLPPVLLDLLRRRLRNSIRFQGNYPDYSSAFEDADGYDSGAILEKVLISTQQVQRGDAAYERDSVTFAQLDFNWPMLSALLLAYAKDDGYLNVLDFGGALGSSFFQHRTVLNDLPSFQWNVVEQVHYASVGKEKIKEEGLQFYASIAECVNEQQPNVILLSSVLQYLPDPYQILHELSGVGAKVMVIDRTPMSSVTSDRLVVQRVPPSIYEACYPMWIFSRNKLLSFLEPRWELVARTMGPEGARKTTDGFGFRFEGAIFEAQHDSPH